MCKILTLWDTVKVAETQFLSSLSGTVTTLRSFLSMVWFSTSTYFLIRLKWSVLIVTNLDVYSAVLLLWFFKWQCLWLWHDNVNLLYDFVPMVVYFFYHQGTHFWRTVLGIDSIVFFLSVRISVYSSSTLYLKDRILSSFKCGNWLLNFLKADALR